MHSKKAPHCTNLHNKTPGLRGRWRVGGQHSEMSTMTHKERQDTDKNCRPFYINTKIKMVQYLEKCLTFACGSGHQKGCSFVFLWSGGRSVTWNPTDSWDTTSGWYGSRHTWRIEVAGSWMTCMQFEYFRHGVVYLGSFPHSASFLRRMVYKQTQNLHNTNNCPLISIAWYKSSFSKQAWYWL